MIEIDGELFEDYIYLEKTRIIKERILASLKILFGVVETLETNPIPKISLLMAMFQSNTILSQPIFPKKYKEGGIVVPIQSNLCRDKIVL